MNRQPETYTDYLKRISGFGDFVPLSKEQWEWEVGVVSASVPSFNTMAGNSVAEFFAPVVQEDSLYEKLGKTFARAMGAEVTNLEEKLMEVLTEYKQVHPPMIGQMAMASAQGLVERTGSLPEVVTEVPKEAKEEGIKLDHLPEGSH